MMQIDKWTDDVKKDKWANGRMMQMDKWTNGANRQKDE